MSAALTTASMTDTSDEALEKLNATTAALQMLLVEPLAHPDRTATASDLVFLLGCKVRLDDCKKQIADIHTLREVREVLSYDASFPDDVTLALLHEKAFPGGITREKVLTPGFLDTVVSALKVRDCPTDLADVVIQLEHECGCMKDGCGPCRIANMALFAWVVFHFNPHGEHDASALNMTTTDYLNALRTAHMCIWVPASSELICIDEHETQYTLTLMDGVSITDALKAWGGPMATYFSLL